MVHTDAVIVQATDRLKIVAATRALAAAEIKDPAKLSRLLGALVPQAWPPDSVRDALGYFYGLLNEHPEWEGWLTWYAIRIDNDHPVLCGSIGFTGPPDQRGMVEIGFSVLPDFQGQGLATQMVAAMVQWAKSQTGVKYIEAEAVNDNRASIRVLEKNSFIRIGAGLEPGASRFLHQP